MPRRFGPGGCCQTIANRSQLANYDEVSGRARSTPLGKSGGAFSHKAVSAVETTLLVEVVVTGRENGGKLLWASRASEAQHRTTETSSPAALYAHYQLDSDGIADRAMKLLNAVT